MVRKNIFVFLRSRRIVIVAVLGILLLLAGLIFNVYKYTIYGDIATSLNMVQSVCAVVFIFNLYVSYEYIQEIHSCGVEETVEAHCGGRMKLYGAAFVVLTAVTVFQFLVMALFSLGMAMSAGAKAFYLHILSVSVLNTLLPGLLASFVGCLFALQFKRIKAYALMALIVFMMLPASKMIFGIANDSYHFNIWPGKAFFSDVLAPNSDWVIDYQYGISNELYRWNLIAFWLFLLVAVLLFVLIVNNKKKKYVITVALCFLVAGINLYGYSVGGSKMDLSESPTSVFRTDPAYYRQHEPQQKKAAFEITGYDLKLKVDRELSAEVTMEIKSFQDLKEYQFTLYNGYQLKGVTNESGMELEYGQDGDYITVYAEQPVNSITMKYNGYSPMFYSNDQGVCLPGCFPYYPWAGYQKIYYMTPGDSSGLSSFIERIDLPETNFTAEISGVKNLQTNLSWENGGLRGKTNGLSVMGGFLEEKQMGPYHTVVCTIERPEFLMTEDFLNSLQTEILAIENENGIKNHIDLKQYKIFQINETLMNRASYGLALPMTDHVFVAAFPNVRRTAQEFVAAVNSPVLLTSKEKIAYNKAQRGGINNADN